MTELQRAVAAVDNRASELIAIERARCQNMYDQRHGGDKQRTEQHEVRHMSRTPLS